MIFDISEVLVVGTEGEFRVLYDKEMVPELPPEPRPATTSDADWFGKGMESLKKGSAPSKDSHKDGSGPGGPRESDAVRPPIGSDAGALAGDRVTVEVIEEGLSSDEEVEPINIDLSSTSQATPSKTSTSPTSMSGPPQTSTEPAPAYSGPPSESAKATEAMPPVEQDEVDAHIYLWLTRTNRAATCQSCREPILKSEYRCLYHPHPSNLGRDRHWRAIVWQYFHIRRGCLQSVLLRLRNDFATAALSASSASSSATFFERKGWTIVTDVAPLPKSQKETIEQRRESSAAALRELASEFAAADASVGA